MNPQMSPRVFAVDRGEELPPSSMTISTSVGGSGWQTPVRSYTPDIPSAEVTSPEPIVVRRSKKKVWESKASVTNTHISIGYRQEDCYCRYSIIAFPGHHSHYHTLEIVSLCSFCIVLELFEFPYSFISFLHPLHARSRYDRC